VIKPEHKELGWIKKRGIKPKSYEAKMKKRQYGINMSFQLNK